MLVCMFVIYCLCVCLCVCSLYVCFSLQPLSTEQLEESGVFIVKIRGIPWSCTADDLVSFFTGSTLKGDKNSCVHILRNDEGEDFNTVSISHLPEFFGCYFIHNQHHELWRKFK